ncbi:DUF2884 family protein [Thalassotalea atypica]|uniref:DUF2884 family protein n=1 Tax=Thalassotalea atypica TaxID=2054316 RepID=UPI002572C88E|nr:DUF2884 family protein [Thalassotalea atypica]
MKALLITSAILASSSTLAHDNSCNADLNGGVSINSAVVEFSKNNKPLYKIVDDEYLFVDGQSIDLNSSQQTLVSEYSKNIKSLVPEIKNVALEGMDLAVDGVNLAFNELLGEGNDLGRDLTESLNDIRVELNENLSLEKGLYVDEDGFTGEDILGDDFEERIEDVMESAIKDSMGSLLIAVGQEMLFSGGDMDAFEARMETFGQQIEHEMESRGEALERDADKLCESLVVIDQQEEQLRAEIEALADINMLSVKHTRHDEI